MRLIDADALIKDLKSVTLSNGTLINTNTAIALIEKYPTAYDIDKVVEELKKLKDDCELFCIDFSYQIGVNDGRKWMKKNAIEIVKQGGVSDDVCEWKRRTDDNFLHTSCNNRAGAYSDEFKYCPYCGKKIKVVE